MNTRLLFLLLFFFLFIKQTELKKKHEKKQEGKHGKKHGKHRGRVEDLLRDFPEDPSDDDDDEHDGTWLLEIQDLRGPCDPNPCFNNGICDQKRGEKFKCKCPKPFKGRRCEKAKKVCKKRTCGRGDCVLTSTPPYYECKCKEPFKPPNCESTAACDPSPCLNDGKCIKDGQDFDCVCHDNFSGTFCQVGPDDCYKGDGESYRGNVSETEDGDECLYWNSHFLLNNGVNPFSAYEDSDGLGPHNFCRNPDGEVKPWCFIRRGKRLRWEHCDVRKCSDVVVTYPTEPQPITEDPKATLTAPVKPTYISTGPVVPTNQPTTVPVKPPSTTILVTEVTAAQEGNIPDPNKQFATCGKPQPRRMLNRIYGGVKAIPGAHPWQASLQVRLKGSNQDFRHICGAVLIQSCWMLTAAHCINQNNDMQVILGGLDLGKEESFEQTVAVQMVIVHEGYKETSSAVYNDIALLKLKSTDGKCTVESQYVKAVCLPNTTLPDGTECNIAGWGATPDSEFGSSQLMDAEVLLISQDRCSDKSVYGKKVDDSMFCAGYLQGGIDSCQGDSGGPLTCEKKGTHYLYGLVSWGDSCGKANKPGVYTNVINFLAWIASKTGGIS
ncbi:hyaluronan-binding protein 2-like [Alosa sapidissima]|uniref:hyaluronan-binding protein 2-like n=1 Tax=Alosa sapidissima TaxID=34773 RepID=UPI001C083E7F|nr:hyaluronan-binding protein 2-like [Alosa sapidissima]